MQVKNASKPGYYNDGQGLRLQVTANGTKSWILRFSWSGKEREMGLGGYPKVKLSDARRLSQEAREMVANGLDPILERKLKKAKAEVTAEANSFWSFAEHQIKQWAPGWKNAKHAQQWENTIKQHAKAILDLPIDRIETGHIAAILQPLWVAKHETGRRLRGRLEALLDAARVAGLRSGDNPARWSGHLEHVMPQKRQNLPEHHQAMPYEDVPAFMRKLRSLRLESTSALALEFTILTASRTEEVIGMVRGELDMKDQVWTVPSSRMKGSRDHRVPLSDQAFEIVESLAMLHKDPKGHMFISNRLTRLSNMAMAMCLRGLDENGYTVHGFRSSFRDWAGDKTDHAREVAEAALAHMIGDKAEQAYRRGDALERRRKLMQDWANYVSP